MFGSSSLPVICVCLHIVVSKVYCVVFLVACLRFMCPMVPVSLYCLGLIASSVFSNVYFLYIVESLFIYICVSNIWILTIKIQLIDYPLFSTKCCLAETKCFMSDFEINFPFTFTISCNDHRLNVLCVLSKT
jgi:hypothetical protein